jgi:hypothetical protein
MEFLCYVVNRVILNSDNRNREGSDGCRTIDWNMR